MDLEKLRPLLDPYLKSDIISSVEEDGTEYVLIMQQGEFEAALSLVRVTKDAAELLSADILNDPTEIAENVNVLHRLQEDLGSDIDKQQKVPDFRSLARISEAEMNRLVYERAIWGVDNPEMNSAAKAPPVTNHGRLACAWAVNKIVKLACGQPVGGGLQTSRMIEALNAKDRKILVGEEPAAGLVIISPTHGRNIGHVGILGENMLVYSNSSREGMWKQSHTVKEWVDYYRIKKDLPVYYFSLNPLRYSLPLTS